MWKKPALCHVYSIYREWEHTGHRLGTPSGVEPNGVDIQAIVDQFEIDPDGAYKR